MRQAERILKVKELFAHQEFVDFERLCSVFGASKSSMRRDLLELEQKGLVRRVHGGAISLQGRDEGVDFGRLSGSSHDENSRIGQLAPSPSTARQTTLL